MFACVCVCVCVCVCEGKWEEGGEGGGGCICVLTAIMRGQQTYVDALLEGGASTYESISIPHNPGSVCI